MGYVTTGHIALFLCQ